MPIDSNLLNAIANPAPVKLNDPLETYGNYLRASSLQGAIAKAKREENQNAMRNKAFRDNTDEKGVTDYGGVRYSMAQNDVGDSIGDVDENRGKVARLSSEVANLNEQAGQHHVDMLKSKVDAIGKVIDNSAKATLGLSDNPAVGFNQFVAQKQREYTDPTVVELKGGDPARIQDSFKQEVDKAFQAAKSPETWAAFRADLQGELAKHKDLLLKQHAEVRQQQTENRLAHEVHFENTNLGGHQVLTSTNKDGTGHRVVSDTPITPSPNRPVTNINNIPAVVESEYGKKFAGTISEQDTSLLDAARKAPSLVARADRIVAALKDGNIITGSGADIRLSLAKFFNLAGGTDSEKVANTEQLISDLSRNTLDSIRSSGLGSGQGFTDKDREFLEKAVGGKITLDSNSLIRLATLSRRSAEQSAMMWNNRVRHIPASALQGVGIGSNPIALSDDPSIPTKALKDLRANHSLAAEFEAHYNLPPGTAQLYIGGTQAGNRPLAQGGQ